MDETPLRKVMNSLGIRPHRARDWLNAPCPLAPWRHPNGKDRHPSFGALIVPNGVSVYKCYACKSTGRISSLVRTLEHYRCESYPGLALEADMADMTTDFGDFERPDMGGGAYEEEDPVLEEAAYGDLYPPAWDHPEARAYLQGRGIGGSTAAELELRWDDQEARVLFTTRNGEGGLLGWTGRTVLAEGQYPYAGYPKVRDYQGLPKRNLLLGAHRLRPDLPLIVVEGLFGYAHLVEQGVRAVADIVALLGSSFTPVKTLLVKTWNRPTYLLVDNDDGGEGCLFGELTIGGERKGGGAVDLLYGHVPLYIPAWPVYQHDTVHHGRMMLAGTPKMDPDELTFEEVNHIIWNCPPFVRPDPEPEQYPRSTNPTDWMR